MDCQKTKYRTKADADINIAQIQLRNSNIMIGSIAKPGTPRKVPMRAYLCPDCGTWHLTSKLKSYDELNAEIEFVNERFAKLAEQLQIVVDFDNEELKKRFREVKQLQSVLTQRAQNIRTQKEKIKELKGKNDSLQIEVAHLKKQIKNQNK